MQSGSISGRWQAQTESGRTQEKGGSQARKVHQLGPAGCFYHSSISRAASICFIMGMSFDYILSSFSALSRMLPLLV
jgi:hypothetical protein